MALKYAHKCACLRKRSVRVCAHMTAMLDICDLCWAELYVQLQERQCNISQLTSKTALANSFVRKAWQSMPRRWPRRADIHKCSTEVPSI
eukprot:156133-Pelagomonas_calceolata.AAC.5